jgi:hypothetical protein
MRAPPDQPRPRFDPHRTDASGEVDLEQIEHNLSLTPEQRLFQYFDWLELMEIAREAGRSHYGVELRVAETPV